MSGSSWSVKVTTRAGSITLSSAVGSGSGCVVIGMNGRSSLVNGCAQVPFNHDQGVKYGQDSPQYQSDPFYKVYPDLWGKIGNYSAFGPFLRDRLDHPDPAIAGPREQEPWSSRKRCGQGP